MTINFSQVSEDVHGEDLAAQVAAALVIESMFFAFEPLPDGYYRFTVKEEAGRALAGVIEARRILAEKPNPILVENMVHWDLTTEEVERLTDVGVIYYCPPDRMFHLTSDADPDGLISHSPDEIDALIARAMRPEFEPVA